MSDRPKPNCLCGCVYVVHQHFHELTYCGFCGRDVCRRYRPQRWWHRLFGGVQ